jgi:hypothetical protein
VQLPGPDTDIRPAHPDAVDAVARAPELLNNDPAGFAWGVWHDRTPKLVAQILDGHPYGAAQRRALEMLLAEIGSGPMRPLPSDAPDAAAWQRWGSPYLGHPWADAPFLWSESYFFRRVMDALDFFRPGPWFWIDPFEQLKAAELGDPSLEADLAALDEVAGLPPREQAQAKLLASLWGNRADLGFRVGMAEGSTHPEQEGLVADQSAELLSILAEAPGTIIVVADNAGRELVSDLVLIDHLLQTGAADRVDLHVKPHPYYVSDATSADVLACLRRLAATPGTSAQIAARLWDVMSSGHLAVSTHWFHTAPWSYHYMPADLAAAYAAATLTVMKGDLNYRRLVGDRARPAATPFDEVTRYFPSPVAALRTLKSDVATGIKPDRLAALNETTPAWRTTGTHGLIQLRHK